MYICAAATRRCNSIHRRGYNEPTTMDKSQTIFLRNIISAKQRPDKYTNNDTYAGVKTHTINYT